ncbi:hypothetical protein NLI96_g5858 [Meripilus lineatus]|uniref:Uncharacterized protein n=1 Tax=Meripilus lineatus TaxID=2056292 RepID=A0AAD5V235_9APHY|nr:hypothetical protein NLI96_g5858 [Physisporinus lineatus]
MSNQVFFDDRDPSLIYFGDWLLDGTGNPKIYDGTLSESQVASSGVSFQFNGTQISVFGTVRPLGSGALPPISTYKIDGNSPVTYTAPNLTGEEASGILFFASNNLAAASHVLVINVTRASQGGPYMLDYITVQTPGSSSSSSVIPSSSSNTLPPSSSLPSGSTSKSSSSPSSSASEAAVTGSTSKTNIAGPVAGGVIGGLVLLAAIILAVFFWCRRRKRRGPIPDFMESPRMTTTDISQNYNGGVASYNQSQGYDYSPGMTTPFLATHTDVTSPTKPVTVASDPVSRPSMSQAVSSSYSPGVTGYTESQPVVSPGPQSTVSSSSGSASASGSRSAASGKAALLSPVRPLPTPSQTVDSGVRFGRTAPSEVGTVATELPPAYTAD